MQTIKTANGKQIFVDNEDFEKVKSYTWNAHRTGRARTYYAVTTINGKKVYMHVLLFPNVPKGMERNHIDHNGLNNQRDNIEVLTHSENMKKWHENRKSKELPTISMGSSGRI